MIEIDTVSLQFSPELDPSSNGDGAANQLSLRAAEWLGPLAPIALSPFFGLAVLSGVATYGPDWLQDRSALFHTGGSLDNPWLFWTMAILALFTSLPRFTKVSKPVGLAAEKLETYSAMIILIGLRLFGSEGPADSVSADNASAGLMLSAGVGTFSLNIVMAGFAALNVFVVNCVKLFFEFLVWMIPIPAIDAVAELCNKSFCGGLMALYCYSPWLATLANLTILAISLVVFLWVYRRMNYYQHLIVGPVLAWLFPGWFAHRGHDFPAFIESSNQSLPKFLSVTVHRQGDGYRIVGRSGFSRLDIVAMPVDFPSVATDGWICQRMELKSAEGHLFVLSHRRWVNGDALFSISTPSVP